MEDENVRLTGWKVWTDRNWFKDLSRYLPYLIIKSYNIPSWISLLIENFVSRCNVISFLLLFSIFPRAWLKIIHDYPDTISDHKYVSGADSWKFFNWVILVFREAKRERRDERSGDSTPPWNPCGKRAASKISLDEILASKTPLANRTITLFAAFRLFLPSFLPSFLLPCVHRGLPGWKVNIAFYAGRVK